MSKRLIGYGYTNANGVATLDYDAEGNELESSGYVGQGVGNVDISASAVIDGSTFVSGTFKVMDTLLYDTGTDDSHNIWTGDTSNLTRNSEYSRLEESASPTPTAINTVMPTGLWVLTMSMKRDGHYTNWNINILNNNVSVFGCATPTNDVWTDITLVYDGSFIYYFENGSTTPTKKTSVMLDDTKNTVLRLQTPQDITYLDFKDLIVLREGQSNISIGSTTPIIQSGSTATINGTLYESGLPVQNATLDVYKNGTKVGTASTGDSGVASYTYSGTGAGATEFQFKYGSILSEIFVVIDGTFFDMGTSENTKWNGALQRSYSSDGTTLTATGNWQVLYAGNPSITFLNPVTVEFDITALTDTPSIRFYHNSTGISHTLSQTGHYKFVIGADSVKVYRDGVEIQNWLSALVGQNFTLAWQFSDTTDGLTFKNFVVYPI